ncbi:MAG: outer membrane lipoprotein-sorting protein, partial [Paludibacter sp.]|nr:outer membrane lipoprotein-sorting protein [Paludibacter sp.]
GQSRYTGCSIRRTCLRQAGSKLDYIVCAIGISYIEKSNYVCYKVEYYDFSEKLNRIQSIDNYKKQLNGKYFAYKMSMENVQTRRKSEMSIDKFQIGSQLPESAFALTALE